MIRKPSLRMIRVCGLLLVAGLCVYAMLRFSAHGWPVQDGMRQRLQYGLFMGAPVAVLVAILVFFLHPKK